VGFFNYHMPPFLTVMGALFVLVALPILVSLLRERLYHGVLAATLSTLCQVPGYLFLALAALIITIFWLDLPVTLGLKALDQLTHSYTFWDFICSCAEGGFVGGVLVALILLANWLNYPRLVQVSKLSLMASIYGGLANGVLKFILNRQRPAIGLDPWHFFAFFRSGAQHLNDLLYAYNSMPSGHTITTVAALMPFYLAYPKKSVRLACIVWAVMVAFSRIYTINHWLSDVMVATILGIVLGRAIFKVNQGTINEV
jgi:membrane-associated phospholipid phosphatase